MKNIIIIILCLFMEFCYSQRPGMAYEANTTNSKEASLNYDEIEGNPFLDKNFLEAKVICCNQIDEMRYDMYADEIQYKKNNIVYTLLKEEPYSKIIFTKTNTSIILGKINKSLEYFMQITEGKYSLLKKIKVKIESTQDNKKTGFGLKSNNSTFKQGETNYFIKISDSIYLIKNMKDLQEFLPEKSNELNVFFNSNRIKFNKETDLKKLIDFLNK